MKAYQITSLHNVYLDSYKDGELDHVNSYDIENVIFAENVKSAIEKYFENVLYYKFNFSLCYFDFNQLFYSVLVDADNYEATKNQIQVWKMGKSKLYSNNITISVFELNAINFDTELNHD